jgi:glycosyltransferase involved in cell wall biosynthesis
MREILLDVTRLLDRALQKRLPTGIDRVSLEYVRHYRERARALVRFGRRRVTLGKKDSQRVFAALLSPDDGFERTVYWCVGKNYVTRWIDDNRSNALFNIGHSGLDRGEYPDYVRRYDLRPIFFLHDLIPISHPEYCRPGEAEKHRKRLATMLTLSRGIIVNSAATASAMEDYAVRLAMRLPPWIVAPLAPSRLSPPAEQPPLDAPYFVVLGTIEPRKNHWLLLHIWRQLILDYGDQAPRLVIIGQRGWECEQVVDLLERCTTLSGAVIELANCTDRDLGTWLHHARALLFPSFVEGFGIPLVEALALKVPVITSDLPVLRETGGHIPEYLDPLDGRAWRDAILDYARPDSAARRAQCQRMEGYKAPTWDDHFQRVDSLVEQCLA